MTRGEPMSNPLWLWEQQYVIPSHPGAGGEVIRRVLAELERCNWPERDRFDVHLAMEEALVNAIKHGNLSDRAKSVYVACRLADALLQIEVRDEGPGFDPLELPNPTDEDRLDLPNGRGVMLMRSFMSRVEYSPRGNCVWMEKCRRS